MTPDTSLLVFPPVVVEAAATARAAGQAALEAQDAIGTGSGAPHVLAAQAFRPAAGAAYLRLHTAWSGELSRLADSLCRLGDGAEAAAGDYVRTDATALSMAASR